MLFGFSLVHNWVVVRNWVLFDSPRYLRTEASTHANLRMRGCSTFHVYQGHTILELCHQKYY